MNLESRPVKWLEDTHALVHFSNDNTSSIVPVKRLEEKDNLLVGQQCNVLWSNKKKYEGMLMCSGSMAVCAAMQDELESDDESDDLSEGLDKQSKRTTDVSKKRVKKEVSQRQSKSNSGKENKKPKATKPCKRSCKETDKPTKKEKNDFQLWIGKAAPQETAVPPLPSQMSVPPLPSQTSVPLLPSQMSVPPLPSQTSVPPLSSQTSVPPLPSQMNVPPLPSQTSVPCLPSQTIVQCLPSQTSVPCLPSQTSVPCLPSQMIVQCLPSQTSVRPLPSQMNVLPLPSQTSVSPLPSWTNVSPLLLQMRTPSGAQTNVTAKLEGNELTEDDYIDLHEGSDDLGLSTDEEEEFGNKIHRVIVDGAKGNRTLAPVHYTDGLQDKNKCLKIIHTELGELKKSLVDISEQQANLTKELQEINTNVKTMLSTGIAKHLAPYIEEKRAVSDINTEVTNTEVTNTEITNTDITNDFPSGASTMLDQSLTCLEVKTSQPYSKELLSLGDITPIFTKSHNRHNFAALMVKHLFDVPTRMRSNVSGRGKEQLDPEIMKYIKVKAFEYYECKASDVKKEWSRCVTAIDDKSRALRKVKTVKPENIEA